MFAHYRAFVKSFFYLFREYAEIYVLYSVVFVDYLSVVFQTT